MTRDLRGLPPQARERELNAILRAEYNRPYDVATGPLFSATLVRIRDREHYLILRAHHMVCDGLSIDAIERELETDYTEALAGTLTGQPVPAASYWDWLRERWLDWSPEQAHVPFWLDHLADPLAPLAFPPDRDPAAYWTTSCRRLVRQHLEASLVGRLAEIARSSRVTMFIALLTVFKCLLSRLAGESDILVGTMYENRPDIESQSMVGNLATNVVIRSDLSGEPSFRAALARVRQSTLDVFEHGCVDPKHLELAINPDPWPTLEVLSQFDFRWDYGDEGELMLPGVLAKRMESSPQSNADLSLRIKPHETRGYGLDLVYNPGIYDAKDARRVLRQYVELLRGATEAPDQPISGLDLPTQGARARA